MCTRYPRASVARGQVPNTETPKHKPPPASTYRSPIELAAQERRRTSAQQRAARTLQAAELCVSPPFPSHSPLLALRRSPGPPSQAGVAALLIPLSSNLSTPIPPESAPIFTYMHGYTQLSARLRAQARCDPSAHGPHRGGEGRTREDAAPAESAPCKAGAGKHAHAGRWR